MNDVINLMKSHRSVRRFKQEEIPQKDLKAILRAGQMASSWKNFQSYSIIVVKSHEKRAALYDLVPQEAIRQAAILLLFVGDLNRAQKAVALHTQEFHPEGVDNLLITSVDAALVAQNTLLAAESLGYGGVVIGLVRYKAKEVSDLFDLPPYTYPVFALALGVPDENHAVKPRLPLDQVVFEDTYQEQDAHIIKDFDQVQKDYADMRATNTWSERLAEQFSQLEPSATADNLKDKKLL